MFRKKQSNGTDPIEYFNSTDNSASNIEIKLQTMLKSKQFGQSNRQKQYGNIRVSDTRYVDKLTSLQQSRRVTVQNNSLKNAVYVSEVINQKRLMQEDNRRILKQTKANTAQEKNIAGGFENQLKGLIKIIYKKEKQIQMLKNQSKKKQPQPQIPQQSNISQVQSRVSQLNVDDIKQATQKILQLSEKQQQLHNIIDTLLTRQEQTKVKIKSLFSKNKQLQRLLNYSKEQANQMKISIEQLTLSIKDKDGQILRLNGDIVDVIRQARQTQNQLIDKVNVLETSVRQGQKRYKQIMKQHEQLAIGYQQLLKRNQAILAQQKLTDQSNGQYLTQLANLRKQLDDTVKLITEKQTLITKLTNELQVKQRKERQLQLKLKQSNQKLTNTEEELKNSFAELQLVEIKDTQIKYLKEQIQKSVIKEKQFSLQRQQLSQKNNQLTFKLQQKQKQLIKSKNALTSLKTQLSTLQQQLYHQQQKQKSKQPTITHLRQQKMNRQTIRQYKTLLQQLKSQLQQQQSNHAKEIQEKQCIISEQYNSIKLLQQQIAGVKEEIRQGKLKAEGNLRREIQRVEEVKQIELDRLCGELKRKKEEKDAVLAQLNKVIEENEHIRKRIVGCQQLQKQVNQLSVALGIKQKQMRYLVSQHEQRLSQSKIAIDQLNKIHEQQTLKVLKQLQSYKNESQSRKNQLERTQQQLQTLKVQLKQQRQLFQTQSLTHKQQQQTYQSLIQYYKTKVQQLTSLTNHSTNILSLPTINNISNIDLLNSSFEHKLELVTGNNTERNNQPVGQLAKIEGRPQQSQRSQPQNESFLKYQQELLKELEQQCNQPTHLFLGNQQDKEKMVELSQLRQSLKMTKDVNFQLFQQISKQEKDLQEFKATIRPLMQFLRSVQIKSKSQNHVKALIPKLQALLSLK